LMDSEFQICGAEILKPQDPYDLLLFITPLMTPFPCHALCVCKQSAILGCEHCYLLET